MRLTELIKRRRGKILGEWITFARKLEPWASGRSERELRDHAEEMLSAIVADMKLPQSAAQQAEKSKGEYAGGPLSEVGEKHAVERLAGGLTLDQLVSEYRALRASVLRMWDEEHGDEAEEMTRFNEAIDETLAQSAASYSGTVTQTREQFLAMLGHDLRNPLAAILMGATMLTRPGNTEIKVLGVATRISNSAERMSRMINDLLDLTRTRLGAGIPVVARPIDLTAVAEQVIAELSAVHPDRSLRFEAKGDLRGEWDSDRLTQVISNLVANALQHGSEDTPVTVVAEAQGADVEVRVHNEGPAIATNAIKTIFEPMVRPTTTSGARNPTGLGLGLYIAREIVTAHGGTVVVASTARHGTTFTARLPRRIATKRAARKPQVASRNAGRGSGSPRRKARVPAAEPARASKATGRRRKKK